MDPQEDGAPPAEGMSPPPQPDFSSLPANLPSPWPVRAGMALVVLIYCAYSSFGIACPFLWGHHGYHGATYMLRAIMTLRFHTVMPSNWAGYEPPPMFSWYVHHPIGYHYLLTLLIPILGNHEWVARGTAAAGGLLVLAALYAIGRRWWSREGGLLACAVFVFLPIVTSFSVLSDPMFPALALCIVTVDLYLRYLDRPTVRTLAWACGALILGGLLMWEAYFQAVFHALHALARLALRAGRRSRIAIHGVESGINASLAWVFVTGVASSLPMAFHLLFTWKNGMLADFLGSYHQRHDATKQFVLDRHTQWSTLLYGAPVVRAAELWIALFVVRALVGKARRRDQAVIIFALINTLYVYLFAEGAAVHEYREFFYSGFVALAVMDLIHDLYESIIWLSNRESLARHSELLKTGAVAAALAVSAGWFAVEGPHALHNLIESREMMGTHGLPGYNPEYSKQLFAMEVARRTGPKDYVLVHSNLPRRIEFYYYMDRSNADISSLSQVGSFLKQHPKPVILMDTSPSESERKLLVELLKKHPAFIYDHYMMIDLRSDKPGIHEYQYQPLPITPYWFWFVSHKYPPMKAVETNGMVAPALYVEARLTPPKGLPDPVAPPKEMTLQALTYHNFLVLRGDQAGANVFQGKLRAMMTPENGRLGELAEVVGLKLKGRTGAELLVRVGRPPPVGTVLRYRLVPIPTAPQAAAAKAPPPAKGKKKGSKLHSQKTKKVKTHGAGTRRCKGKGKGKRAGTAPPVAAPQAQAVVDPKAAKAAPTPPVAAAPRPAPPPAKAEVPVELSGEIVVDLDASHTGFLHVELINWTARAGAYELIIELAPPTPPRPRPAPPTAKPPGPSFVKPLGSPLVKPLAGQPPAKPLPGQPAAQPIAQPALSPTGKPAAQPPAQPIAKPAPVAVPPPPLPPPPPPPKAFCTVNLGRVEIR